MVAIEKKRTQINVQTIPDKLCFELLREMFNFKYGSEKVSNSLVLADQLGLDLRTSVEYELQLEEHLQRQLGIVDAESIRNVCPNCLVAVKDGLSVLQTDAKTGEIVCINCGYIISEPDEGEQDNSLPFDAQWKPSSDLSVGGSKGGTLYAFNYRKGNWSAEAGLNAVLSNTSSLAYVDFDVFAEKYPLLAQSLVDFECSKGCKGTPYAFADGYVYRLRTYRKGPRAGLKVIDKVSLREFEASGKSAFDCMKIRAQRLQSMLGVELPGQDQLLIMGTQLANKYGIGFSAIDKVFMNSLGANIRKAFSLTKDYDYKVKKKVLVDTMFFLTLKLFRKDNLLMRCQNELTVDFGLYDLVLQLSTFIKTLQERDKGS